MHLLFSNWLSDRCYCLRPQELVDLILFLELHLIFGPASLSFSFPCFSSLLVPKTQLRLFLADLILPLILFRLKVNMILLCIFASLRRFDWEPAWVEWRFVVFFSHGQLASEVVDVFRHEEGRVFFGSLDWRNWLVLLVWFLFFLIFLLGVDIDVDDPAFLLRAGWADGLAGEVVEERPHKSLFLVLLDDVNEFMQCAYVLPLRILDELCLCHNIQNWYVIRDYLDNSIHLLHVISVPHAPHLPDNSDQRDTPLLYNSYLFLFFHQRSHDPMCFLNLQTVIPEQSLLCNALQLFAAHHHHQLLVAISPLLLVGCLAVQLFEMAKRQHCSYCVFALAELIRHFL